MPSHLDDLTSKQWLGKCWKRDLERVLFRKSDTSTWKELNSKNRLGQRLRKSNLEISEKVNLKELISKGWKSDFEIAEKVTWNEWLGQSDLDR